MRRVIIVSIIGLLLSGCTDASCQRQTGSYGKRHSITLYSGGKVVGQWVSTGYPESLSAEDGWQFVDSETKELIIITGDVVIKRIDK